MFDERELGCRQIEDTFAHAVSISHVWAREESNLGPATYQIAVLPLNYAPKLCYYSKIMTKAQKLEFLWAAIRKAYPNRTLVFNDGDPDAKIMIIGEAPGQDEERQGKPFVGRAGKLLTAALETLGWQRSDFYITNIVKYRPADPITGSNRTPTPEEIAKFRPAIEKEIAAVDPALIVVLGKVAMTGMGIEGSMGANRGQIREKLGRKILITYPPAAILRNINWEPQFREDLAKISNLILF